MPQLTTPARNQRPDDSWHTNGPPESPCNSDTDRYKSLEISQFPTSQLTSVQLLHRKYFNHRDLHSLPLCKTDNEAKGLLGPYRCCQMLPLTSTATHSFSFALIFYCLLFAVFNFPPSDRDYLVLFYEKHFE